jgi:hypothetical protein
LGLLLATLVTVATVTISKRAVSALSLGLAVVLGIVRLSVVSISVVAAVPIPVALISGATIVLTVVGFARGKAVRYARG